MKNVGVFGSCVSRDAFNSNFVSNYKDFFKIIISSQRNSLISIMQDPFIIDEDLIKIYPVSKENNRKTDILLYEFNRTFFKELIEKNIDCLIIDNYLEIIFGVLYVNNNIITNNTWDLEYTPFYKNLDDKFEFSIMNFPEEYFFIWTKYCDLFFKFLEKYRPNIRVVLNKGRLVYKVLKKDGSFYIDNKFKKMAETINPILDKLDSYIYSNFDVEVNEFDFEKYFADENHLSAKLNITNNVDIAQNKHVILDDEFKKELKILNLQTKLFLNNLKFEKLRQEYERNKKTLNLIKDDENSVLSIYKKGRFDFKNFGSKFNSIEIIKNDDLESNEVWPAWFKSDEGEGLFIESKKGVIDLKIKCIGDGHLKIWLRGPDVRDKNNEMFPVFIDYTKCLINNKLVLNNSELVWHNRPYLIEMDVSDSEILNIHIEWSPFNKLSIYKKI